MGARTWPKVVAALVAVLLLVGALTGITVVGAARDLRHARDLIDQASEEVEDGRLAAASADLDAAVADLLSVNETIHLNPLVGLGSGVPGLRANIDALRRIVDVALVLAALGGDALDDAAPLQDEQGDLEVPLRAGSIPLDVVRAVQLDLAAITGALPNGSVIEDTNLLGVVRDAATRIDAEVERRRPQLRNLENGLRLLYELAGGHGPRRYLIAVANTAEMRGSGGMWLSYGVLESAGGDFELPAFGGIDELALDAGLDPAALSVPADELVRWGGLDPTRLWRNVNLVPDLSVIGPRALAMYEAATGQRADGVLQIDANGLAAILEGIGPVNVPGVGQVDSTNVVALTLNEAYTRFPDRDQRQEVLGDVAEAVFDELVEGRYDSLRPLATALAEAAAERHLTLWAPSEDVASPAAFFEADAELPDPSSLDHLFLTVQNFSQNKLDYYLDTGVTVTGDRPAGESAELAVAVQVTNTAPDADDLPDYVAGPGGPFERGAYTGVASLYVPNGTTVASVPSFGDGQPQAVTEGGRTVVTWQFEVAPGESDRVELRLRFPPAPSDYRLTLVPLPRVRPTTYDVDVAGPGGPVRRAGPLERAEVLEPG